MKLIIAGSRDINISITKLDEIVKSFKIQTTDIECVISGTARGIDRLGESWASNNKLKVVKFPADWDKYGKQAGMIRNRQMAEYGTHLLAIWDGNSSGTKNMIQTAKELGLKVFLITNKDLERPLFN